MIPPCGDARGLCSRRLFYSERGAHEFGDGFFLRGGLEEWRCVPTRGVEFGGRRT
jgi:hypothetical protein